MFPQLHHLHLFQLFGDGSINYQANIPPHPAPVLHIRDTLISEPVEVANELGNYFSQVSSSSHLSQTFLPLKPLRTAPLSPSPYPLMSPIMLLFLLNSTLHYSRAATLMKALMAFTIVCSDTSHLPLYPSF